MRFFLLSSFLAPQGLFGVVITHAPAAPLLTLPDPVSDIRIDVNFDGSDDFFIGGLQVLGTSLGTFGANRYLAFPATFPDLGGNPAPLNGGQILGPSISPQLAWLNTDVLGGFVSSDEIGAQNTTLTRCLSSGCTGTFYTDFSQGQLNALLGFEFQANDGVHYGYFDLTFNPLSRGGFINGWAYESEPGKSITTAFIPEPTETTCLLLACTIGLLKRKPLSR